MKRFILFAIILVGNLQAYTPPIGIPNPSTQFGWEIDRATPAFPPQWLSPTPSEVPNFYYIDKTATTTTTTGFGHPGLPRRTIPEGSLPAGTFIYIHAGTYTGGDSSGDRYDWIGSGTSANPIWITGNPTTRPVIQDLIHIGDGGNISYLILENIEVSGVSSAGITIRPTTNGHNIDHILIRNVLRVGTGVTGDPDGILIGISQSTDPASTSTITDVVVYNCEVHGVGAHLTTPTSDDTGIYNGYHTKRVWVLDNLIYDVAADGIAGSHYSNYTTRLTEDYYIGRNTTYGNGENGIDLKNVQGFVVSQNVITGPFTRENGWGIVLHYGADSAFHPRNGVVIFNRINHCSGGVYTGTSSGTDNMDIIGNVITDIKKSLSVSNQPEDGACIQMGGSTIGANSVYRIVNNTFHDYDRGILLTPHTGDLFKIHGNIFSNRSDSIYYELDVPNTLETTVTLDYNFYTGTPAFRWMNASRTLSYMRSTAGQETHAVTGNALFVDTAAGNFRLSAGSPAIDVSVEGPVGDSAYAAFLVLSQAHTLPSVALDIKVDFDGRARPVDAIWDIGAFESALPPNAAPSNLQVSP